MKRLRQSLAIGVIFFAASGCLEYEIASPEKPIILARNPGWTPRQLISRLALRRIEHRQIGLRLPIGPFLMPVFPPYTGSAWSINIRDFHRTVYRPFHDVVLVGEHKPLDFLISLVSLGALSSNTVTLYDDVKK